MSGTLYTDDCLEMMQNFLDTQSIDLIYADPPFFTNRDHAGAAGAYSDKWADVEDYLDWLRPRLREMRRVLKPTGSIYLHCDWHASHYIKVAMDELFGYDNFRNEIAWQSSYGGRNDAKNKYGRGHDNILFYAMPDAYFSPPRLPLSKVRQSQFRYVDKDGEIYTDNGLAAPRGGYTYEFLGVTRRWAYPKRRMQELLDAGCILHKTITPEHKGMNVPRMKFFLRDSKGKVATSLWLDVTPVIGSSKEKIGYPTQKPLALLRRIITASSNEGDLVLDPFCGSGTTCVAAEQLGRKYIGIDQSPEAVQVARARLEPTLL